MKADYFHSSSIDLLFAEPPLKQYFIMAITEFVLPPVKQDESTRSKYQETWPAFIETIKPAVGGKGQFFAPILTENDVNVQSAVKYALGLEWENTQNIYDFIATPGFHAHAAKMIPLLTAPLVLEIYHTDLSPRAVFSSPLTEVFRIKLGAGGSGYDLVRDTWINFVAALESSTPGLPSVHGSSLNLDQQLFLGVIGWEGNDARESIISKEVVKEAKSKIESLKGVETFTVSFVAL